MGEIKTTTFHFNISIVTSFYNLYNLCSWTSTFLPNLQFYVRKLQCFIASYTGKTFRHMKVRVSEHQGLSPQTGKPLKGTFSTSVRDHMLDCTHVVAWDDFTVLGRKSNHWLLEIKESLFIKRDRPSLNKNIFSILVLRYPL